MKGTRKPVRSVEVAVEGMASPRWRGRLRAFCQRVLREAGADEWDMSILLCNDARIRQLNGRYRGKDRPTDVLSFPRDASPTEATRGAMEVVAVSGDIAISLDTMRRNAADFEVAEEEELKRLLVHGILHCAGMDHGTGKGRKMLALQERLLKALKEVRIIET
jgi:probable rRNA maturation factor